MPTESAASYQTPEPIGLIEPACAYHGELRRLAQITTERLDSLLNARSVPHFQDTRSSRVRKRNRERWRMPARSHLPMGSLPIAYCWQRLVTLRRGNVS